MGALESDSLSLIWASRNEGCQNFGLCARGLLLPCERLWDSGVWEVVRGFRFRASAASDLGTSPQPLLVWSYFWAVLKRSLELALTIRSKPYFPNPNSTPLRPFAIRPKP